MFQCVSPAALLGGRHEGGDKAHTGKPRGQACNHWRSRSTTTRFTGRRAQRCRPSCRWTSAVCWVSQSQTDPTPLADTARLLSRRHRLTTPRQYQKQATAFVAIFGIALRTIQPPHMTRLSSPLASRSLTLGIALCARLAAVSRTPAQSCRATRHARSHCRRRTHGRKRGDTYNNTPAAHANSDAHRPPRRASRRRQVLEHGPHAQRALDAQALLHRHRRARDGATQSSVTHISQLRRVVLRRRLVRFPLAARQFDGHAAAQRRVCLAAGGLARPRVGPRHHAGALEVDVARADLIRARRRGELCTAAGGLGAGCVRVCVVLVRRAASAEMSGPGTQWSMARRSARAAARRYLSARARLSAAVDRSRLIRA